MDTKCNIYILIQCELNSLRLSDVHYGDVTMGVLASKITSLTIVYTTVHSDTDQRKHQSSASLAFVWGIHWWPVNSPHKWPVMQEMFPFDDIIMYICVSNLTIIGSDNGLSPGWRQAIICVKDGILLVGPLGTNFSEILAEIHMFSFKKMHLKMSSVKWDQNTHRIASTNIHIFMSAILYTISYYLIPFYHVQYPPLPLDHQ